MIAPYAPSRRTLFGVALVCFANLLLEIVLTRIFSATMFYHFTFLAIALALFGLGAAGVFVYVKRERFTVETLEDDMARYARRFAAATILALIYVLADPIQMGMTSGHDPEFTNGTAMQLVLLNGVTALPFFFAGVVVSLAVTHYRKHIDQLYSYDLCGAGAAALLAGVLLGWFGGPSLVIVIALCGSGAALLLQPRGSKVGRVGFAALALLLGLNLTAGVISIPSVKGVEAGRIVFERWNSFSRVTVEKMDPKNFDVKIDSSASTRVTSTAEGADWRNDISSLAYALFSPPPGSSLVIGPGGGRDVSHALAAGTAAVTGVEVNPIIADRVMRGAFVAQSGNLYADPRVTVIVDEGRSFVRRSHDRFDVVQASLVDTWAATAAGAFALSENTLYTLEAFDDYYDHLTDRGVVTMTRWFAGGGGETARLVMLAAGALQRRGVPEAELRRHVYLASDGLRGTLIAKKAEFLPDELTRLDAACDAAKFTVVLTPGANAPRMGASKTLAEMLDGGAWGSAVRAAPENLEPPTDDRPFFFYFQKSSDFWRVDRLLRGEESVGNPALWVLLAFGLSVTALAVAFIVLPLILQSRSAAPRVSMVSARFRAIALTYFGLIGLAFITVEIALMQKFTFFLGHPTYALIVVLFALLVGTAIGARLSGRVRDDKRRLVMSAAGLVLLALCVAYALALGPQLRHWVGWPLPLRVALAGALVGMCGIPMGTMLPAGVRLASNRNPELIPWAWGINGATSVIGTVGATIVAIHAGFTTTLVIGALLYGLGAACAWTFGKLARTARESQDLAVAEGAVRAS